MAASFSSCSLYHRFHRQPPHAPTLPLPPAILPLLATSRNRRILARGKFEKFDRVDSSAGNAAPSSPDSAQSETPDQERPQESEDDSVLPSDLVDAIRQSSQASAMFISSGGIRAIRVKAIFPDAGAAALLKYLWKDANFGFSSLSDRKPVDDEDEVVVMIVPDYQMLEYVERIAAHLSDDPPRSLIMWNPRLVSEDVGVGFNVRKLRKYFLSTFTVVYSLRPLPSGAIFRCYPGMWKVFYDDVNRPNRYLLAKEQPSRPDATDIELIFGSVAEKSEEPSLLGKAMSMFTSLNRFMKAISS